MSPVAGFRLAVVALLLMGFATQLDPIDVEQNNRLGTIEAYLWGPPTQEQLPASMTASPTFRPGTNTFTPTRTVTPAPPSATFVPTSAAATATTISLPATPAATPTPTELPPMSYAGNISGVKRWVRMCASLSCEIIASVNPGGFVTVNAAVTKEAENFVWVQLWNESGWIAMQQVSPPVRYLALRP